jgi:diphthamide synthase (EF-2-diphthine--ammonia ligase)
MLPNRSIVAGVAEVAGEASVLVFWSGGTNSAWMLHELQQAGVAVAGLLATVGESDVGDDAGGLPRALLEAQAEAAALPLEVVALPRPCADAICRDRLGAALAAAAARGVTEVAFPVASRDDVRALCEELAAAAGLCARFPLWERDTLRLAVEMLDADVEARVVGIDTERLDGSFLGSAWDESFLIDLPPRVDPCGQRGEFVTFAVSGPMFRAPVSVEMQGVIDEGGFVRALLAATPTAAPIGGEGGVSHTRARAGLLS